MYYIQSRRKGIPYIQKKRRKANCIGHILGRNCLLEHGSEGNVEGRERRGRRLKQLLDDLKETRGYCKLKEEALDLALWRTCFRTGNGPVRQTTHYVIG